MLVRDFTISINGAEKPTLAVVLETRTGTIRWITRVVGVPGMARVDEDPLLSHGSVTLVPAFLTRKPE